VKSLLSFITCMVLVLPCLYGGRAYAQDDYEDYGDYDDYGGDSGDEWEEPAFRVYGSLKLQAGVFVPLLSDGFKPQEDEAYYDIAGTPQPCDPIRIPSGDCLPVNHGIDPGMSMGRGTFQLEAEWKAHPDIVVFGILRGVRAMKLKADEQVNPIDIPADADARPEIYKTWARDHMYNELDIRELYVDAYPTDWFSLRIGRQQVAWGDLGQFRLLDVVNPANNTWHWATLESYKDTRIPLWIAKGLIEFPSIEHSLELLWAPLFFDRPGDTVNAGMSWVGAWGLPLTNTPGNFVYHKEFNYPGGELKDMRAGLQWKGVFGPFNYSLVYYYTHQMSPVPTYYIRNETGADIDVFNLEYPRQHITGLSMEYAFDNPIGTVAKIEGAVELPITFAARTNIFNNDPDNPRRNNYFPKELVAINYGIQLFRPTMIRFLNPTQNFLMVLQFLHTIIPGVDDEIKKDYTVIPNFNKYPPSVHSYTLAFVTNTTYMHGLLKPGLSLVWVIPEDFPDKDTFNFFYTLTMDFRFNEVWSARLTWIDFFGDNPYKSVGLFRDRDEINLGITCQF